MSNFIRRFTSWCESGDILLPVILVSVAHYTKILMGYDWWAIAAFLGFSIDLSNFRAIKLYLKGKGWTLMVVTSIVSLAFHIAFYVLGGAGLWGILLGSAVPIAIFSMAYISKVERLDTKLSRGIPKESGKIPTDTNGTVEIPKIPNYETYIRLNESRNGQGPLEPAEMIREYGVKRATAYRWYSRYHGEVTHD